MLKRLMLNIIRMWKCGHNGIYFNNVFYIFVEIMYYHIFCAVQQFCIVTSCVCWVCWLRSWASIPSEMLLTWFYVNNILFLEIEININAVWLLFKICHHKVVTWALLNLMWETSGNSQTLIHCKSLLSHIGNCSHLF